MNTPAMREDVATFLAQSNSPATRARAMRWLTSILAVNDFDAATLLDARLNVRLAVGNAPTPPDSWLREVRAGGLRSSDVFMSDLHRAEGDNRVYLELVIPVPPPDSEQSRQQQIPMPVTAILDLRINADTFLFPFMQHWPVPSQSAETLLVERDGDHVLYLNELRHRGGTALRLGSPLSVDLPAAMAIEGRAGTVEGVDYRNVPVLSAFRGVAGTPWFLVAKIDQEEAFAPLREEAMLGGSLVAALLLAAILGWALVWRKRRLAFYLQTLAQERKRAALFERFAALTQHAKDMILLWDTDLKIVEANDAAIEGLGYTLEEFKRLTLRDLLPPEARGDVDTLLDRSQTSRATVESMFRRSDGSGVFVESSVASISMGGNQFYQAILRDISERKRAEEELRLAAMVYQHSMEAIMVTDATNRIIAVNRAFTQLTGYAAHEVIGDNPRILSSGRQDKAFYESMWRELAIRGQWQGEIWNRHKNGNIYAEWLNISTIRGEDGSVHRRVALFFDITEKKISEDQIWHQANYDKLTDFPNRSLFRNELEHEIKKAKRESSSLALLFIDLDNFKEVNDMLGHHAGDLLLIETARRIRECMREYDIVGRMGGDEFTVILPQLSSTDTVEVERIAQHVIHVLSAPFQLGNEVGYISASIGIALYPDDANGIDDLLRHADHAMYEAKRTGRNCYRYFTRALQEVAEARSRLSNDLRVALKQRQFVVYYQPIVELVTGSIHKAEALIRWQHPQHGLIGPAEFIPLAERIGIIGEIGDWLFSVAAPEVKRWRATHHPAFQVSVNRSPLQFRNGGGLNQAWVHQLKALALPGQSIVIEITEGLLLDVSSGVQERLLEFHNAGVQISIDDFGTGYSALSYLKKFDVDYLKIDQSFVFGLTSDPNDRVLCKAIIAMAHELGLKVIAEGIETEAQRDLLAEMGSDFGQGYLFSRPVPAVEFDALLHTHH